MASELGKTLVKNKLAIAVALEIEGGRRHQRGAPPQAEMTALPTLPGHDAATGLKAVQPAPAKEGQGTAAGPNILPIPQQSIPFGLRKVGHRLVPADLQLSHGTQDPARG